MDAHWDARWVWRWIKIVALGVLFAVVVTELVRSADEFAGVVLVNGHGGNIAAVNRAVTTLTAEGRRVLAWSPAAPRPATPPCPPPSPARHSCSMISDAARPRLRGKQHGAGAPGQVRDSGRAGRYVRGEQVFADPVIGW